MRLARSHKLAKRSGGIADIASVTGSHPKRGRRARSSISSKAPSAGKYAAQLGIVLPLSRTIADIAVHPIAVSAEISTARRTAMGKSNRCAGRQAGSGLDFGGGARDVGAVGRVGASQFEMSTGGGDGAAVDKK